MASAHTTTERSQPHASVDTVRRVTRRDEAIVDALVLLLQDAVADGASVGFLAPLAAPTALRYWRSVFDRLGQDTTLWVYSIHDRVIGTVQLVQCQKENGRHRAELAKLLVLRSHRNRGIARALLTAAETQARERGLGLLHLDTIAGSQAEFVYRRLGWSRVGEIPQYAALPDGALRPTAIYYKLL